MPREEASAPRCGTKGTGVGQGLRHPACPAGICTAGKQLWKRDLSTNVLRVKQTFRFAILSRVVSSPQLELLRLLPRCVAPEDSGCCATASPHLQARSGTAARRAWPGLTLPGTPVCGVGYTACGQLGKAPAARFRVVCWFETGL